MNVTEIRKLVRNSEDRSWYKSLSIYIEYSYANFELELEGLDIIYQFFVKQHEFFQNNETLPNMLKPTEKHFRSCIQEIEGFVTNHLINNRASKESSWSRVKNLCQKAENRQEKYFNKESETTDFLLKLDSEFNGASKGAYDFFTNQTFQQINSNKNYFIGWQRAYEFFTQDADLIKRRNNEKQTLGRIRSEYIKNIETIDSKVDDHIAEKESLYQTKEQTISKLIKRKNNQYENWKTKSQDKFSNFLSESDKAFKGLESLYSEKLKLEAPAKYWHDRANKLKGEGDRWMYSLIICTVLAILALGAVLYFISDGTLKELFEKTGSAIRWSIVFLTFVSFLAYAIRTFAKLMFSAYHLVRDAEEREQLAYVYLALKKEQSIDDTERHLIMQSIFSRADSGLLRDDAAPTMPGGGVLEKIIGGK